jgi:hypothetical protein
MDTHQPVPMTCVRCARPFVWSVGEQRFFARQGLPRPLRCPACIEWRKRQRATRGLVPDLPRD